MPPEQAYMSEWHSNMTQALAPLANPAAANLGIFNPACFIHTNFNATAPLIAGVSYLEALARWYDHSGPPATYKLADDCGIMCNPTCPPGP